jgi:uncharacterized protein (TIGR02231 family)
MRHAFILPALCLTLAAADPIPLTAPIQKVRLHPDEAWVTRVGRTHVTGPGVHRLVIKDLPQGLELNDVRVSAKGPQDTRLGDLNVGSEAQKVTESPEYQSLKKEVEKRRDRVDALEAEGEALAQEQLFLKGLQASYDKELSGRMAYTLPDAAGVVKLSKGIQERLGEIFTRDRRRRRDLAEAKEEASRAEQELQQRAAERSASPGRAQIEVNTARSGDVEVELTYRTRQARWEPAYEARLSADGKKVELVLFASVRQDSGEDWSGVQLEVTNARASRSLTLASYKGPQVLSYSENPPYAKKRASFAAVEVVAQESARLAPPPPPPAPAQNTYVPDGLAAKDEEAAPSRKSTAWRPLGPWKAARISLPTTNPTASACYPAKWSPASSSWPCHASIPPCTAWPSWPCPAASRSSRARRWFTSRALSAWAWRAWNSRRRANRCNWASAPSAACAFPSSGRTQRRNK